MPRTAAIAATVAALVTSIGLNIHRYPVVWEMAAISALPQQSASSTESSVTDATNDYGASAPNQTVDNAAGEEPIAASARHDGQESFDANADNAPIDFAAEYPSAAPPSDFEGATRQGLEERQQNRASLERNDSADDQHAKPSDDTERPPESGNEAFAETESGGWSAEPRPVDWPATETTPDGYVPPDPAPVKPWEPYAEQAANDATPPHQQPGEEPASEGNGAGRLVPVRRGDPSNAHGWAANDDASAVAPEPAEEKRRSSDEANPVEANPNGSTSPNSSRPVGGRIELSQSPVASDSLSPSPQVHPSAGGSPGSAQTQHEIRAQQMSNSTQVRRLPMVDQTARQRPSPLYGQEIPEYPRTDG